MQTLVPLSKLVASETNVRRAATDLSPLKSSILSLGLLQPLLVTVASDESYAVLAGGRRLAAMRELVADGLLDADKDVAVNILAGGSNVEASLAENIIREGMTAADEVRAFKALADEGADAEDIARRFGKKLLHVKQRLALANLEPTVFQAFEDGILSLEAAQIFTLNPDHVRQRQVFEANVNRDGRFYGGYNLRSQLLDEPVRGDDARAKLVGAEAFTEAGGQINADLFDDNEGSFWSPQTLLHDLAEAKMLAEADKIKAKQKLGFVRVILASHIPYDFAGCYRAGSKRPKKADIGEAQVGRILLLGRDGAMKLDNEYWTDRKAKNGKAGAPVEAKSADELGAKAKADLADQRRDILRAALIRRPEMSQAIATFIAADKIVNPSYGNATGSRLEVSDNYGAAARKNDATKGPRTDELDEFVAGLDRSWIDAPTDAGSTFDYRFRQTSAANVSNRLDRFLAMPREERDKWAAFALVKSLNASINGGDEGAAFHGHLGHLLEIDVRAEWTPSIPHFFAFPTKGQMLALITGTGDEAAAKFGAKLKSAELREFMVKLTTDGHPEFETASKALAGWSPDYLAFPKAEIAEIQSDGPDELIDLEEDELEEEDA